jgi:eukaryotic-like serine/threonine-protein kinase
MKTEGVFQFGESFQVDVLRRTLLREKEVVTLNRRAFDLLLYLVQNPGKILTREELLKNVWPDTFVDESSLVQSISALRRALEEKPGDNNYIVTLPGRGYQFVSPVTSIRPQSVTVVSDEAEPLSSAANPILLQQQTIRTSVITTEEKQQLSLPASRNRAAMKPVTVLAAAAVLVGIFGGAWYWKSHQSRKLGEQSTIVIADFANSTGDPVFDGTLRQGLSSQLEQSPFLNLLSDQRIAQTLSLMTRTKETVLTRALAQEVCQRTESAAVLNGAIAQVGTRYLLTLDAINCVNGERLASTQAQASDKNRVLDALGKVASEIRGKLGESLASVQKYDIPPENVTTSSLEALQAYSLGCQTWFVRNDGPSALPLFQRAISLDPSFAMAYARLGTLYFNGEPARAIENLQKAYDLRERVSERERLYISAHHADIVDGDLEAARKIYELWAQLYPRDTIPLWNLTVVYEFLGDYERVAEVSRKASLLTPGDGNVLVIEVNNALERGRFDEAKAAAREAQARHLDFPQIHRYLFAVDFLLHDTATMEQEEAGLMGKVGWEQSILYFQSDTAAYGGHLTQARELTRRAAGSAERIDRRETSAEYVADAAVREAVVGNLSAAKQQANAALVLAKDTDVEAMSAVALGLAGAANQSTQLATELNKNFPKGTTVQRYLLPTIRAATVLRHDPAKAIEVLTSSGPYELGQGSMVVSFNLYGVYLRGEAYLATRQGSAAAVEFQKIVDHPGLVINEPIGALAHLGLGRSYVLTGDTGKAKAAYQDFFALWKDADSDIPILKEAKAEYAKLN